MVSSYIAQLKPLPSHLVGRTLALSQGDLPGKRPLQAKRAPWTVCRDVLHPEVEQEQIGHDRHGYGALDAADLFGNLMLSQAHHSFQFFHQ
jgi:hypothetical protein